MCDALAPLVQATPQLKWPNDVLLEGRKVCGVLTETVLSGAVRPLAVVGFGVNVLSVPGPLQAPNAGCVAMYSAYPVTILDVLGATLAAYDELLTDLYTRGGEGVWQAWRAGLTFGGRVQVRGRRARSRAWRWTCSGTERCLYAATTAWFGPCTR
ncbi:MAG: hypothetical protein WKH64_09155 [Chloroflexia bacterium]